MQLQPYLFFNGRAEEAVGFYQQALGAQVEAMMRFSDNPEPMPPGSIPPGAERKIMHGSIRLGDVRILVSDGDCSGGTNFGGFSIALTVDDEAQAKAFFSALSVGGSIQMPQGPTFFAQSFGIVTDRFGVSWMILWGVSQGDM